MKPWVVISFDDENSVATIPNTWLSKASDDKDICYWPNSKNVTGYVKRREKPLPDWQECNVTILGSYAVLDVALRKTQKAEDTSELTSGADILKRKRTKNVKYAYDLGSKSSDTEKEESDNDDYPKLPKVHSQKKMRVPLRVNPCSSSASISDKQAGGDVDLNRSLSSITTPTTHVLPVGNGSNCNDENSIITVIGTPNTNILEDKEFKRQVLTKLNIIMAKLSSHDQNFEVINQLLENKSKDDEETVSSGIDLLPVSNDDSLAICEQFLQSDLSNLKKLARELSRLGGRLVTEITRKIMYRIMTNEFAQLYSWEGGKGKRKFVNLTLSRLVIDAVRYNKRTQGSCEDEIVQEIKRWLAKAKERQRSELNKKERLVQGIDHGEDK